MTYRQTHSEPPDFDTALAEAQRPREVLNYRPAADETQPWRPLGRFLRRTAYAAAFATIAGGLGLTIQGDREGPPLMAAAGAVLGIILPIPGAQRRRRKSSPCSP